VTVLLGTPATIIGKLPLCPTCYETSYRPLVQHAASPEAPVHVPLIVAPDALARRVPR
jgi:hypothetical protein